MKSAINLATPASHYYPQLEGVSKSVAKFICQTFDCGLLITICYAPPLAQSKALLVSLSSSPSSGTLNLLSSALPLPFSSNDLNLLPFRKACCDILSVLQFLPHLISSFLLRCNFTLLQMIFFFPGTTMPESQNVRDRY